jgi:5'-nucleotidase / UDP-sugar diphosphatase
MKACRRRTTPLSATLPAAAAAATWLALALFALPAAAQQPDGLFELTLLHVNDTHSHLQPAQVALTLDLGPELGRKPVVLELGGFPRLATAVEQARRAQPNTLFLHGGDIVQGTLYFTQFQGKADMALLNSMGLDVAVVGNHELDKGPALLAALADLARFPLLSASMDSSAEPLLAGRVPPWTIRSVAGRRVGIVGVTTADAPLISSPGPTLRFREPDESVAAAVRELEAQGVDKIVVLSHLGYRRDLALAASVRGIDVIVGGHSHTLLGRLADLGLYAEGDYPTVVRGPRGDRVLVVQAWDWAKVLGRLNVVFDGAGRVTSWSGSPLLLAGDAWMRISGLPGPGGGVGRIEASRQPGGWTIREHDGRAYTVVPPPQRLAAARAAVDALLAALARDPRFAVVPPDERVAAMLAGYGAGVEALKAKVVAHASADLRRGSNRGPGPLVADAMLAITGARIAIMNPGGVRTNIAQGPVSVAQIYELQPFGNTLVTVELPGADIVRALEDMTDFTITRYEPSPLTAYIYIAGIRFDLAVDAPGGSRVRDVQVKKAGGGWEPLRPVEQYSVVVNSFMAAGGDGNETLKAAAGKVDTGYVDSEAMLQYLEGKTLDEREEQRVRIVR